MNRQPKHSLARPVVLAGLVAAPLVLGACDPLAGPDYPGEPLLTVGGEVTSALEAAPSAGTSAAIVWVAGTENGQKIPVADAAAVEGEFPARFSLDVYHPPEESSLVAFDGGARVGLGFIIALPADAALGDAIDLEEILGISNRHVVVYVPTDDDLAGMVALRPDFDQLQTGFNLIDVAATTPAQLACRDETVTAIDACHADCTANCDPDSAADPGCDLCRAPCNDLSDDLRACDALVDAVVPATTPVDLLLDPGAVAAAAVWTVFGDDAP